MPARSRVGTETVPQPHGKGPSLPGAAQPPAAPCGPPLPGETSALVSSSPSSGLAAGAVLASLLTLFLFWMFLYLYTSSRCGGKLPNPAELLCALISHLGGSEPPCTSDCPQSSLILRPWTPHTEPHCLGSQGQEAALGGPGSPQPSPQLAGAGPWHPGASHTYLSEIGKHMLSAFSSRGSSRRRRAASFHSARFPLADAQARGRRSCHEAGSGVCPPGRPAPPPPTGPRPPPRRPAQLEESRAVRRRLSVQPPPPLRLCYEARRRGGHGGLRRGRPSTPRRGAAEGAPRGG